MVKVVVKNADGTAQSVTAETGQSLMEALRANNVEGIVAECGGSLSCATCHVIVDDSWLTSTGEISDMEEDMLDCTATERETGSRLSCQIELSDKLDGLTVWVPDGQL